MISDEFVERIEKIESRMDEIKARYEQQPGGGEPYRQDPEYQKCLQTLRFIDRKFFDQPIASHEHFENIIRDSEEV